MQSLEVAYNVITDVGLKELKELKSLRWLALNGNDVTEAGLKELKVAFPKTEISSGGSGK